MPGANVDDSNMEITIGIINVSDRAHAGKYEGLPGKEIVDTLRSYLSSSWTQVYGVVPDEQDPTDAMCHKMLPGFGELMPTLSLKYASTAILLRQTAGVRNQTLIINLPGKPESFRTCFEAVFPAIPY